MPVLSDLFAHVKEGDFSSTPKRRVGSLYGLECSLEVQMHLGVRRGSRLSSRPKDAVQKARMAGLSVCDQICPAGDGQGLGVGVGSLKTPVYVVSGGVEAGSLEDFCPSSQARIAGESLWLWRLGSPCYSL